MCYGSVKQNKKDGLCPDCYTFQMYNVYIFAVIEFLNGWIVIVL